MKHYVGNVLCCILGKVSRRFGCHERYDALPRDKEYGWAKFNCHCGNEFQYEHVYIISIVFHLFIFTYYTKQNVMYRSNRIVMIKLFLTRACQCFSAFGAMDVSSLGAPLHGPSLSPCFKCEINYLCVPTETLPPRRNRRRRRLERRYTHHCNAHNCYNHDQPLREYIYINIYPLIGEMYAVAKKSNFTNTITIIRNSICKRDVNALFLWLMFGLFCSG